MVLAERIGVAQSTLVRAERNASHPDGSTLVNLGAALGVTVEWLLNGDEAAALPSLSPQLEADADADAEDSPETIGQRRGFEKQVAAARKELARRDESVEEWVWPFVAQTNNYTLDDSPPSVAMLCSLARHIASFAAPPRKEK